MTGSDGFFGLIEAGGTKFVCAIGRERGDISERAVFPTRSPEETMRDVIAYFRQQTAEKGKMTSLGVGCFGPLDLDRTSKTYGYITGTSKPGWSNFPVRETLARELEVPVEVDTDVNAALLAEARHGAGKGLQHLIYITIGTGIGAGIMMDGRLLQGAEHPEVGHMFTEKLSDDRDFDGVCPYHGDRCFEGLASGPAMMARWGVRPPELPADHPAWDLQARYLATLCLNLSAVTPPSRIILGGGVMQQDHVLPLICKHFAAQKNGYGGDTRTADDLADFIVRSQLRPDAGVIGALELAIECKTPGC